MENQEKEDIQIKLKTRKEYKEDKKLQHEQEKRLQEEKEKQEIKGRFERVLDLRPSTDDLNLLLFLETEDFTKRVSVITFKISFIMSIFTLLLLYFLIKVI